MTEFTDYVWWFDFVKNSRLSFTFMRVESRDNMKVI